MPPPTPQFYSSDGRHVENLAGFFLSQRHHIFKAMLRDVEIVAVGIGAAGLGIGPTAGTRLGQLIGIDLFQSLDDLLAALHFESKMVQTVRRVLLIIVEN